MPTFGSLLAFDHFIFFKDVKMKAIYAICKSASKVSPIRVDKVGKWVYLICLGGDGRSINVSSTYWLMLMFRYYRHLFYRQNVNMGWKVKKFQSCALKFSLPMFIAALQCENVVLVFCHILPLMVSKLFVGQFRSITILS